TAQRISHKGCRGNARCGKTAKALMLFNPEVTAIAVSIGYAAIICFASIRFASISTAVNINSPITLCPAMLLGSSAIGRSPSLRMNFKAQ
ncbi:MAG: hypothetical protein ACRC47_05475, partial [Shewanella sp.]